MTRPIRAFLLFAIAMQLGFGASTRLLVVISDTHFGVGRKDDRTWQPMEDARWPVEFDAFLKAMHQRGGGTTDLVLNGDTFELWQSLDMDCIYPDAAHQDRNLGCNQADALHRLNRVLSQHHDEIKSLREFAAAGDNRIYLVPGNHDAALTFDAVAQAVIDAIAAPPGRVIMQAQGYWRSPDGQIYAEHGHQIGEELNRFDHWPTPFIEKAGVRYLQRPWGEQLVQQFYNDWEEKYPAIDNFVADSIGLGYAFAAEGKAASFAGGVRFFRTALFAVSLNQFARSLGGATGKTQWDVDKARQQGQQFFVDSIPKNDPLHDAAAATLTGSAPLSADDISDDEIRDTCDHRAEIRKTGPDLVPACPAKTEGAVAQGLFRKPRAVMSAHLNGTFQALHKADPSIGVFQIYIYSHTHDANPGFLPFDNTHNAWQPRVVNTGAWQRVATQKQFEEILKARGIDRKDALAKLRPEDLPACYDVVLVDPYTTKPQAKLTGWSQAADGKWALGTACH